MKLLSKKNTFYALYAFLAFIFFLWYLFPSDYFADFLEAQIRAQGNGMTVSIDEAGPSLPFALSMKGVRCETPAGNLTVDKLRVSPGLISLFRGNPEFSFSVRVFGGSISGHVLIPKNNFKKMSVEDLSISKLDLSMLNDYLATVAPGYSIAGRLNAEGSYSSEGRGNGMVNLSIKDLVISPEKPFFTVSRLTFTDITSEMEIKSKKVQIKDCVIEGNEVGGSLKGSVFVRQPIDRSTLRLSGTLRPDKTFIKELGRNVPVEAFIGKKMNEDGEIPFRISGVASAPRYSLK